MRKSWPKRTEFFQSAVAYPCSGLHGLPVKLLANRFANFVYIDYHCPQVEVDEVMDRYGVKGYELTDVAPIDPIEVIDMSWDQYTQCAESEYNLISRRTEASFLRLYTFNRLNGFDDQHGKETLQLMFAGAESISFMRLVYNRLAIAPACLIHVRSGLAFGGNYREYPQELARLLRSNPAGFPQYLVVDANGQREECGDYLDLVGWYVVEKRWPTADRGVLSFMQLKI